MLLTKTSYKMDINTLNIDESAKINVKAWLEGEYDEATKQAIRDMASNPTELNESFYRHLEFGTGGLRGIMGVGTNRMNKSPVAMATQGLANYVKKVNAGEVSRPDGSNASPKVESSRPEGSNT